METQIPPQGPPPSLATFPGAPGGVNLSDVASEIADNQAQMIQDAFVNQESYIDRRGPVQTFGRPALQYKGCGAALALAPDGNFRMGFLEGDSSHGQFRILNTNEVSYDAAVAWPFNLPADPSGGQPTAYRITDIKPAIRYASIVSTANGYAFAPQAKYATGSIFGLGGWAAGDTEGTPSDGDQITIAGKTYTFKTAINNSNDGEILIESGSTTGVTNVYNSLLNLKAAINLEAGSGTKYSTNTTLHSTVTCTSATAPNIGTRNNPSLRLTAKTAGTAANAFALTIAPTGSPSALTFTSKLTNEGTSPGSTYTTSSTLTPVAGKAYIICTAATGDVGTTFQQPVLTLNGMQMQAVSGCESHIAGGGISMGAAGYIAEPTPGSGTISVSWPGSTGNPNTVTVAVIEVDNFYPVRLGSFSAQMARQAVGNSTAGATSLTVTAAAFGDAVNNAAFGFFTHFKNEVTSPGSGFTELTDQQKSDGSGHNLGSETEYKIGEDTSIDASWSTSAKAYGVAFEVVRETKPLAGVAWWTVTTPQETAEKSLWTGTFSGGVDGTTIERALAFWAGGSSATYTGTITSSRGSTAVSGSGTTFTTSVTPGMWLAVGNNFIGCVKSITDNTNLVLTSPALSTQAAQTGTFQALRGYKYRISKGSITVAAGNTAVTGGNTKFQTQAIQSGWDIYKKRDFTYVGSVTSVQSDTALTLTAGASQAMASDEYIALSPSFGGSMTLTMDLTSNPSWKPGTFTASYAGRQWYANNPATLEGTYRVWFSDPEDPEILDFTFDGDWIEVPSTSEAPRPIMGLAPAYNSLVVLKEDETFAIYGSDTSTFELRRLYPDGTLSNMSVQTYNNGVVWAGREGIYYYDGSAVNNMVEDTLGQWWKSAVKDFDPNVYRMWSMLARDHYILFVESISPPTSLIKRSTTTTPTRWTVAINMTSGALTFLSNVDIRGSVQLTTASGQRVYWVANDSSVGQILNAFDLFDQTGVDGFACDGNTAGPDFFFESKKFPMEDPLRLKRFKQLTIHHRNSGGRLWVDTVIGLNNVGVALTSPLIDTVGDWKTHRLRFTRKSQHFSFRLYQDTSAITRLNIGPYQLKYKQLRPGRV